MRYLSLFSGIECASVAWKFLGWKPVGFSEIEPFPCAVLAHHYPDVPNLGDIKGHRDWKINGPVDLVCGGSPCQSFSVAGLRKGLDDPRGNLALEYLSVVDRVRPRWIVYENVPGLLSADQGRAFGAFIGGLEKLGYHAAWRVLDAQYGRSRDFPHAVPQRRRRVWVVGYLGDWRRAAAVLFDPESLSGNSPPCREAGQGFAHDAAPCLTSSGRGVERTGDTRGQDPVVAHALRGEGFDASEDGTGRGTPIVPAVASALVAGAPNGTKAHGALSGTAKETNLIPAVANPLTARMHKGINTTLDEGQTPLPVAVHGTQDPCVSDGAAFALGRNQGRETVVAFTASEQANSFAWERDHAPCLTAQQPSETSNLQTGVRIGMAVRRLTPTECERLMGLPDRYTRIPYRNKPAEQCPDGPRYKALGNGWAVNSAQWIGERIALVDAMAEAAA